MSTLNYNVFLDLQNRLESTRGHWHVFEIQPQRGGRITYSMDIAQDRPLRPFTVFQDVSGRRVIIPPGEYVSVTGGVEYISDPSAPERGGANQERPVLRRGSLRLGSRWVSGWVRGSSHRSDGTATTSSSCSAASRTIWSRSTSVSFTSLASVQGLIQYAGKRRRSRRTSVWRC